MKKLALVVIMTAITTLSAAAMGSASSGTLVITQNTTLTEDHIGNISLDADNITLDCAGHTVSGPGVIYLNGGINGYSRTGITVKRCVVTVFQHNGIYVSGSGGRYEGNLLYGNQNHGMALDVGSGNVVIQNTSRSNGGIGIVLTSMTDSLVANNTVQDNRWSGIALFGDPSGNTLRSNTSNLNRQKGFWLTDSGENIVESNTAVGNKDLADGIEMDRSHKNVFINNVVNRNFVGFKIYMSNENTFTGNICNANGAIGFWVIFSSSYNTFTHNVGRNNPEDDADEDSSSCIGNVWSNNNFGLTSLTTY